MHFYPLAYKKHPLVYSLFYCFYICSRILIVYIFECSRCYDNLISLQGLIKFSSFNLQYKKIKNTLTLILLHIHVKILDVLFNLPYFGYLSINILLPSTGSVEISAVESQSQSYLML